MFSFLGSLAVSPRSDEDISSFPLSSNVLCCCVRNSGGKGGLGRISQMEKGIFAGCLLQLSTLRVKCIANVSLAFEFCRLEQLAGY